MGAVCPPGVHSTMSEDSFGRERVSAGFWVSGDMGCCPISCSSHSTPPQRVTPPCRGWEPFSGWSRASQEFISPSASSASTTSLSHSVSASFICRRRACHALCLVPRKWWWGPKCSWLRSSQSSWNNVPGAPESNLQPTHSLWEDSPNAPHSHCPYFENK